MLLLLSVSCEESPSSLPSQSSSEGQHRLSTESDEHYEPHSESESLEGEVLQSEETTERESNEETGSNNDNDSNTVRDGGDERDGSNGISEGQEDAESISSSSEEDVIVQQVWLSLLTLAATCSSCHMQFLISHLHVAY